MIQVSPQLRILAERCQAWKMYKVLSGASIPDGDKHARA
jgi:hypothetical protein